VLSSVVLRLAALPWRVQDEEQAPLDERPDLHEPSLGREHVVDPRASSGSEILTRRSRVGPRGTRHGYGKAALLGEMEPAPDAEAGGSPHGTGPKKR
jgi:hypothetical protein